MNVIKMNQMCSFATRALYMLSLTANCHQSPHKCHISHLVGKVQG